MLLVMPLLYGSAKICSNLMMEFSTVCGSVEPRGECCGDAATNDVIDANDDETEHEEVEGEGAGESDGVAAGAWGPCGEGNERVFGVLEAAAAAAYSARRRVIDSRSFFVDTLINCLPVCDVIMLFK